MRDERDVMKTGRFHGGHRAAAFALVLAFLGGTAHSAEFIAVEDECNGRQLVIQGAIAPGDHQRFERVLADHVIGPRPAVQDPEVLWTVELDSPGGDLDAAMAIGRLLREALAITEVGYRYARRPDGVWDFARGTDVVCLDGEDRLSGCHRDLVEAECTGACLLIWLAGAARHANEGRVGSHGLAAGPSSAAVTAYLREMAVGEAWVDRLTGLPEADSDGWLDWPARHELGGSAPLLETLVDGCPPALTREESFRSVAAESAAERDGLMDRADAHRDCRRARLAQARRAVVARLGAVAGSGALADRGASRD